jgi:opacity protein-like surface antigen
MFKKLIIGAAIAAALAMPALAADMPVKAAGLSKYTTYPTGCGFFYGVNTMGAAGNVSGGSSGVNSLMGDIGLTAGYTCPIGASSFWFVDGMFDLSRVSGGSNAVGLSIAGTATFEQRVAIGVSWATAAQFVSLFPGLGGVAMPSIPTLPGGINAGATNPYIFGAVHEQDISAQLGAQTGKAWLLSWGAGAGALTRLSNGMVLDTWIEYQAASSGVTISPITGAKVNLGDTLRVGIGLKL